MLGRKPRVEVPTKEKTMFDAAIDWEAARILASEKSEGRAWRVAISASAIAVLAVGAIALMMPLKESVPFVVRVDNTTGVPDIVTALADQTVTGEEIMDKYWLAKYVTSRDTFDWYTLQNDYNTVGLLSSPQEGTEYAQLFEGANALDKQYGKSIRATVKIISVVPNGKNTGTVRFIKTTKRTDQGSSPGTETKWVATVAYEYRNTAKIKESDRLVNPFGFQVLSYRVDPEMMGGAQ